MSGTALREAIERALDSRESREATLPLIERFLDALERGEIRAAHPEADGRWAVAPWVKQGILLAFRLGVPASWDLPPVFRFRDKDTLAPRSEGAGSNVRIVPGGTTIRRGAHLGEGVVVMPPAFVNVGAHVGPGTMIDSHALVGSCAQIGARVHLSAAAQIGGVLEPVGALPVIVEDDAFVGGGCGIYEGTRVRRQAVLAAGVVLTRSVPIVDLVREVIHRAEPPGVLEVPERAVVVPGSRPAAGPFAARLGIGLQTPVIVKYRDPSVDAAATLEEALR